MVGRLLIVLLVLMTAFGEAGAQERKNGFGNALKKFGQKFRSDIQRDVINPLKKRAQPKTPTQFAEIHDAGVCHVYSASGALTDRDPCNRVEACKSDGSCVIRYIWPSGAQTVVQSWNGRIGRINGSSLAKVSYDGLACLRNDKSGNSFCYQSNAQIAVAQESADEDREVAEPNTGLFPPAPLAADTPNPIIAAQAKLPSTGWHYYSGHQMCGTFRRNIHIQTQVQNDRQLVGRMSHQDVRLDGSLGVRTVLGSTVRDIKATPFEGEIIFGSTRREMVGLFKGPNFERFDGRWLVPNLANGGCSALVLQKTEPSAKLFAQIAMELKVAKPSIDDAKRFIALLAKAPDWNLSIDGQGRSQVPDLKSRDGYGRAVASYWQRFHKVQQDAFLPLNFVDKRIFSFHKPKMMEAVALSENWSGLDRDHVVFALRMEQKIADASTFLDERNALPVSIDNQQRACERMLRGNKGAGGINIEYVYGLPIEYWNASSIASLAGRAKACAERYSTFKNRYSAVARHVEGLALQTDLKWHNGRWLLSKVQQYADLKPGLETIGRTNDFEMSYGDRRSRKIDNHQYQRLFVPRMEMLRTKSVKAAKEEISSYFASQNVETLHANMATRACGSHLLTPMDALQATAPSRDELRRYCELLGLNYGKRLALEKGLAAAAVYKSVPATFNGLYQNRWFAYEGQSDTRFNVEQHRIAADQFRTVIAQHYQAAVTDTRATIQEYFSMARPREDSERDARRLCARVASGPRELVEFCSSHVERLNKRVASFNCNRAVSQSGASNEHLNNYLEFQRSGGNTVAMRQLFCEGGKNRPTYSFKFTPGSIFSKPKLVVFDGGNKKLADVTLRISTPRDNRGFGQTLLDIATGENEREVAKTYRPEQFNFVADGRPRSGLNNGRLIGCLFGVTEC